MWNYYLQPSQQCKGFRCPCALDNKNKAVRVWLICTVGFITMIYRERNQSNRESPTHPLKPTVKTKIFFFQKTKIGKKNTSEHLKGLINKYKSHQKTSKCKMSCIFNAVTTATVLMFNLESNAAWASPRLLACFHLGWVEERHQIRRMLT